MIDPSLRSRAFDAAGLGLGELVPRRRRDLGLAGAQALRFGETTFGRIGGVGPATRRRLAERAERLLSQGCIEAAAPLFEALLTLEPEDPSVHLALARCHQARGRLPAAILHLERALQHAGAQPAERRNIDESL